MNVKTMKIITWLKSLPTWQKIALGLFSVLAIASSAAMCATCGG